MRGMIVVFFVIVTVVLMMLYAPAAIEPLGEEVKTFDSVDQQNKDTIDNLYTAVFVRVPMILVFGFGVWGVAWYVRRQRVRGRP